MIRATLTVQRRVLTWLAGTVATGAIIAAPVPASANNYGESLAWQFRTSADMANQAALLDLIQKQRGGYYPAPIYNKSIARQYNCSIAPVATGSQGYQSATANSPTVTGATKLVCTPPLTPAPIVVRCLCLPS